MKNKDEDPNMLELFQSNIKNLYNTKIRVLRSDNEGEYTSKWIQINL